MTNADLASERQKLKRQLANGEYKPLIDVVLDGIGYFIQRIGRGSRPAPAWFSAALMALALLAIDFWASILLNERYPVRLERIPSEIALVLLTFAGITILKALLSATFSSWRHGLIDALERSEDLADIQHWFESVCDIRRQLSFGVPTGLAFGIYAVMFVSRVRGGFIGLGPAILDIALSVLVFLGLYYVVLFVNLPFRVRRYHFKLFTIDPRRSRTIQQLSRMFFHYVYGTALLMAAVTFVFGFFAVMTPTNVVLLLILGWAPIVLTFIVTQYTLSRIINRSKWKVLEKVQKRIVTLHSERDIAEPGVLETTNRLLDFQDRIWASRNSVLNVGSTLGFINSLLLPLIAFALANFEFFVGILVGGK